MVTSRGTFTFRTTESAIAALLRFFELPILVRFFDFAFAFSSLELES